MSINGSENTVAAIELDMQDLLQTKKVRPLPETKVKPLPETKGTVNDYPSEAFQLSGRSLQEIDHLIEGLRGVRRKLNTDRDRLQREMESHAEFSDMVLQLTKIVSESMAHVK